jgi:hypothetical protein
MYKPKEKLKDKPKESVSRATTNSIAQKKSAGKQSFKLVDNQSELITKGTIQQALNKDSNKKQSLQLLPFTKVIQKKDMHYWVVQAGDKQYIGSFKSHAAANTWWLQNKSS